MKLLLYSWKANNEQVLADNLKKTGFDLVIYDKPCKHYTRDLELASDMIPFIHIHNVEAVISFNYFPMLSMICNTCQIPYFSWVYDCPHFTLYARQIMLPCNHIGIFDKEMVRHLQETYQVPTIFHAPLAVDTEYFDRAIREAQGTSAIDSGQDLYESMPAKYRCDVSFVGSLYTDEHNYYDMISMAESGSDAAGDGVTVNSSAALANMDQMIARQCFSYKQDCLRPALAPGENDMSVIKTKMEEQGLMLGEDYFANPEDILLSAVLEKKVTVEERRILLGQIAERDFVNLQHKDCPVKQDRDSAVQSNFSFKLYTGSNTKELPALDACNQGTVDYHTQMPLVFAASRINLNISLRSIHSGIPLRVLDIMACGGFVLSNWQPELVEYFEEGEEIALFGSKEECMEKIAYYLAHEEERREIAAAGKRKVQELFSYEKGLERLFGV